MPRPEQLLPRRLGVFDAAPDPRVGTGRIWSGPFFRFTQLDWIDDQVRPRPGLAVSFAVPSTGRAAYIQVSDSGVGVRDRERDASR